MRINNNPTSAAAYASLNVANTAVTKSIEKLSSGFRINRAADDAAGLVISEKLRSQINGTKVAIRNAQDAIGMVQTADGALEEVTNILQRMRDLSLHYNNGATDADGQAADLAEFDALAADLDRIDTSTTFGGLALFQSTFMTPVSILVGANGTDTVDIDLSLVTPTGVANVGAVDSATLGITAGSMSAVQDLDDAITTVTAERGYFGGIQNRMEHVINNLTVANENLTAAESRIRDTDMAAEMTEFTRAQILSQASTAMLAQANAQPQSVLTLLRG